MADNFSFYGKDSALDRNTLANDGFISDKSSPQCDTPTIRHSEPPVTNPTADPPDQESSRSDQPYKKGGNRVNGFLACLMIVIVAATVVVVVVFTNEKTEQPRTEQMSRTSQAVYDGEVVFLVNWVDAYGNKSSMEFKDKKLEILKKLHWSFSTGTLARFYNRTEVTGLRSGSIVADFQLFIDLLDGAVLLDNGTVLMTLDEGQSGLDAAEVITNTIREDVSLDTGRIRVRVAESVSNITTEPKTTIPSTTTHRLTPQTTPVSDTAPTTSGFSCQTGVFQCKNGTCIPDSWVCNGHSDCQDESDEEHVRCSSVSTTSIPVHNTSATTRTVSEVTPTPATASSEDVTLTTREDMINATSRPTNVTNCAADEFLCDDGVTCQGSITRCNGYVNCVDASDERGCVKATGRNITVFGEGEMRPLCANEANPELDHRVGQAICVYLGFEQLQSVKVGDKGGTGSGVLIVPFPGGVYHFLGQFQSDVVRQCVPLEVECSNEVQNCGRSTVPLASNYIQKGKAAVRGQWPWTAHLKRAGQIVCGASLISRQWVVSAYHCIGAYKAPDFTVILGSHRLYSKDDSEREYRVKKIVKHENFTRVNRQPYNDIVLLLLSDAVTYSDYIQPVCLPRQDVATNDLCYSVGWGQTEKGFPAEILQQVRVRAYTGRQCKTFFRGGNITDTMICARKFPPISQYAPTCQGDSGGPLVCLNKAGRWDLHGAASFGTVLCMYASGPSYGVLSNIYQFKPWILDKMSTECYFHCGDGTCLYNRELLCDGTRHCADGRDEETPCRESVTCDFELDGVCGYTVIQGGSRKWSRQPNVVFGSHPPITVYDHTVGTHEGRFMALQSYIWMASPSVLQSPELNNTQGNSCLGFRFFIAFVQRSSPIDKTPRQSPALQVWTVDWSGNSSLLWSVSTFFRAEWNKASVTLPPATRYVRFLGQGHVNVDDVTHTRGQVCPNTECNPQTEVRCPSTNMCIHNSLLCDGREQCDDDTIDENPLSCGASVNCTFSDSYACGYTVEADGYMQWEWREMVFGVVYDHTNKSGEDEFPLTLYFMHAIGLQYMRGIYPVDVDENTMQSSVLIPEVNITSDSCLEFYFLSFTMIDTKLNFSARIVVVDTTNDNQESELWWRTNDQGQKWRLGQVNLGPGRHNIRIRGEINPKEFSWNLGIDDVRMLPGRCRSSVLACTTEEFQCSEEQCLFKEGICDGKAHCENGAGENKGCIASMTPRLVGGAPYANQGRVEIFVDGKWRSACVSGWNWIDSYVVCQTLGYRSGTVVNDWQGSKGPFHPELVTNCRNTAKHLKQCTIIRRPQSSSCQSGNGTAVVSCGQPVRYEYMVRLTNNSNPWTGLVEVNHAGTWGTVCNSGWDETAANITCRMLGYSGAKRSFEGADLQGVNVTGPVLSGLQCRGNESSLHECDHEDWGSLNCTRSQYVGVECIYTRDEPHVPAQPKHLRLVGGTASSGRVEMLYDGQWGTICDDEVTNEIAARICRVLGFRHGNVSTQVLPGTGPIWLDKLTCAEDDFSLLDCDLMLGVHDCTHWEDVVVDCFSDCDAGEFTCRDNKTCIKSVYECDGREDCPGGGDEDSCESTCGADEFQCQTNQCVPMSARCDGQYQCRDGMDEIGCVQVSGDDPVTIFAFGERRPLCVGPDDVTNISAVVCDLHSLSEVFTVSSVSVPGPAWAASSTTDGQTVRGNAIGFNLESARSCSGLPLSCRPSVCGEKGHSGSVKFYSGSKVSGGGEWPWHVRIGARGSGFDVGSICEGVLLSGSWVLTGENCLNNQGLKGVPLVLGGGTWENSEPRWTSLVAEKLLGSDLTPGNSTRWYDLALLRLEDPREWVNDTSPVCLPGGHSQVSPRCFITTWSQGKSVIEDTGIRELPVKLNITREECDYITGNPPSRKPECVGYMYESTDICKFSWRGLDKSNPIVCRHPSGRWVIEGLTIAGPFCTPTWQRALYTPVKNALPWIIKTIRS